MASPPSRPPPPPPSGGLDDAVAQLRAALSADPSGAGGDAATRSILDALNAEMAKMYGRDEDDGEEDDGEDDDGVDEEVDDEEEYEEDDAHGEGHSQAQSHTSSSRPRPYDLWRAAHVIDPAPKEKLLLTRGEWEGLVQRLNDSSRRREQLLRQAQQRQIAEEFEGLTFKPHISDKSRELALHNKALPERVAALMRKKKAKLDKIRLEQNDKEMAEATFKPKLNKPKLSKISEMTDGMKRHVKHLMEYEKHRRARADQRRQLVQELEDRELTFAPAINSNSARIVSRLNREREEQARLAALGMAQSDGTPGATSTSRAAKKALAAALASGADARALKMLGRSFLPGHEEETFHPRINPRSHALHRPGMDDKPVYDRLYQATTAARSAKLDSSRSPGLAATGRSAGGVADSGSVGSREREVHGRDPQGYPLDEDGEPAPGHPHYFNVVPFESPRMDFILRRIFSPTALAAAAVTAATGALPFVTSTEH